MAKKEQNKAADEMTLEEARAYRAARHAANVAPQSEEQQKEKFRIFWAQEKVKYGRPKELEEILWLHLKAIRHDAPEKFEAGLKHFGLKKVS